LKKNSRISGINCGHWKLDSSKVGFSHLAAIGDKMFFDSLMTTVEESTVYRTYKL